MTIIALSASTFFLQIRNVNKGRRASKVTEQIQMNYFQVTRYAPLANKARACILTKTPWSTISAYVHNINGMSRSYTPNEMVAWI